MSNVRGEYNYVEDFAKVLISSFANVLKDDVGSYEGVMPAVKWLQKKR